jgi:hypothetical protein
MVLRFAPPTGKIFQQVERAQDFRTALEAERSAQIGKIQEVSTRSR